MMVAAEERAFFVACPGFHLYDLYHSAEKCALTITRQVGRITVPVFCVFVCNGHLQQAGTRWEGKLFLRFHA